MESSFRIGDWLVEPLSELPDGVGQDLRLDRGTLPNLSKNLLSSYRFAGALGEMKENPHRFRLDPHPVACLLQDVLMGIDAPGTDPERGHRLATP